ncbi:hypothetical protein ABT354_31005 [Streptomyces sp. NPDC000594]|uniref:phage tail protein n=1 Tax=Streptomyces sp. NPDC000594 TaxID=3154261 RepID=UPI00332340CB
MASSHPPARVEAGAAQAAAVPPKDDAEAQGKTVNAERMNEAEPGTFDKAAFVAAVEKAITDRAPENLDQADKFADSGKAEEVKAEVQGKVGEGKEASAGEITDTTAAPPDTSAAVVKEVTPLAADRPPGAPAAPNAAHAVPDRLPPSATDLSAGPAGVKRDMAAAQVTETQLRKGNEPAFTSALGHKKKAEQHSAAAPGRMRRHEAGELTAATGEAKSTGSTAMAGMAGARVATGQQVGAGKTGAQTRDEEQRAQVTARLQTVFDGMKKDVEAILTGLDTKVDERFTREEKAAREALTVEHKREMAAYKRRRYPPNPAGFARWGRDLFKGLPPEADRIFDTARRNYIRRMKEVIAGIADLIAAELGRAKKRIREGRSELQAEVKRLPVGLRAIGRQAAADFQGRFEDLARSVDDKGTELVDTLAARYTDALKAVDSEIAAEKEKNKGLVDKAKDAITGAINTINELRKLLMGVLAKAGTAIMLILKDPIGFLRNLVTGVGAGLKLFLKNIKTHLQQGIMGWLLGQTASAGLQLPARFDTRGVFTMLASLLGLSWANIRARLTRRVPEEAVAAAETALPVVADVRRRGVAALWDDVRNKVGDLRKTLLDKVIAYATPTIVTAGIMWILSLLNPASAFVRAMKLIIDVVTFVVTRARQIIDFVNAVLDSVIAIARGATGAVPALIERALARAIPVLLAFLAALIGIGGITARVRQIVQTMSRPVNRLIDQAIDRIATLIRRHRPARTRPGNGRDGTRPPVRPGRRPDRGRGRPALGPPGGRRDPRRPGSDRRKDRRETAAEQEDRLRKAVAEARRFTDSGRRLSLLLHVRLALIRRKYGLAELKATRLGRSFVWNIRARLNPEAYFKAFSIPDQLEPLRVEIGQALSQLPKREHAPVQIKEVRNVVSALPGVKEAVANGYRLIWDPMTRDAWVLFLGRDDEKARNSAIGQLRRARDYVAVNTMGDQTIFVDANISNSKLENKEEHYVIDAAGNFVPRMVVRNVTSWDRENIDARPSRGIPAKTNKVITEFTHVDGRSGKSPWVSATKVTSGDIRNPQGELFGAKKDRIKIDLSYISPKNLRDLTGAEGQKKWQINTKKTVEDVVRTQEVLVFGAIPPEAIEWLTEKEIMAERAWYEGKGGEVLRVLPHEDR